MPHRLQPHRLRQGHHQAHDEAHRPRFGHRRRVHRQAQDRHRHGRRHLRERRDRIDINQGCQRRGRRDGPIPRGRHHRDAGLRRAQGGRVHD